MIGEHSEDVRPVSTKSVRLVTGRNGDVYSPNQCSSIQEYDSDSDLNGYAPSFTDMETDEGRISHALQNWMSDYVVRDIEPRERMVREPLFSAKLGRPSRIPRTKSEESIVTQLSLLSCSSNGDMVNVKKRRRSRKHHSATSKPAVPSKWIQLGSRKVGALEKMMKALPSHGFGPGIPSSDEIYDLLDKDEQKMVFTCGKTRGLHLSHGIKKSASMTNISDGINPPQKRVASAGRTTSLGKAINFEEVKRQLIQQKISHLARHERRLSRRSSRVSLRRKSRVSLAMPRMSCPSMVSLEAFLYAPSGTGFEATPHDENITALWAGDAKILEIDLNRDLTSKVKEKLAITNRALIRVTGYGDDNEPRSKVGAIDEYPFFIEEDYGHIPKIAQKVRISPQLSHVIRQDIKVRMGRPRYHEISENDLAMWNHGQKLDRKHRNLKVFTWLHSLREGEFDDATEPDIDDRIPGVRVKTADMIYIRAVDEPTVKPLFERLKTQYVV